MAKILVVEDDRNMRLLTAARLEDMYTVVCANDGIEAMEEIHKGGIDLIIADIMMPRRFSTLSRRSSLSQSENPVDIGFLSRSASFCRSSPMTVTTVRRMPLNAATICFING